MEDEFEDQQDEVTAPAPRRRDTLSRAEIINVMRQAGWDEDLIPMYSAVAMAESSGRTGVKATRVPKLDGTMSDEESYGLFQINMKGRLGADRRRRFGITEEDLKDPLVNARIAKRIYDEEGPNAWFTTIRGGKYKKYLNEADLEQANAMGPYQGGGGTGDYAVPPVPVSYVPGSGLPEPPKPEAGVQRPIPEQAPITPEQPQVAPTEPTTPFAVSPRRRQTTRQDLYMAPALQPPRTDIPELPKEDLRGGLTYTPPTVMYGAPGEQPPTPGTAPQAPGAVPQAPGVTPQVPPTAEAPPTAQAPATQPSAQAPTAQAPKAPGVTPPPVAKPPAVTPPDARAPRGKTIRDARGNLYQLSQDQSGVGKGEQRWELVDGPSARSATVDRPGYETFIKRGESLASEEMLGAERRSAQQYAAFDRDIANKVGTGFVVRTGGTALTPSHLWKLSEGNRFLRQRVEALLKQNNAMGEITQAGVPLLRGRGERKIDIPYTLQAALELNRRGVKFGDVDPERLLQQEINRGVARFNKDGVMTIGSNEVSKMLSTTRPKRVQAANRAIRQIEESGNAAYSPAFWDDIENTVGTDVFRTDPRLSLAVDAGERNRAINEEEARWRYSAFQPAIREALKEIDAASQSPQAARAFSNRIDVSRFRNLPTEHRQMIFELIATWRAGAANLADLQPQINGLAMEGERLYNTARNRINQRKYGGLPLNSPEVAPIYKAPDDDEIQEEIRRSGPVLSADERAAVVQDYATRRNDFSSSMIGQATMGATTNLGYMLLGLVEDVLPTETLRETRRVLESGRASAEGVSQREGRGYWTNVAQEGVTLLTDTPRFLLLAATGVGLPAVLAGDAMLQAKGEGKTDDEVLKAGAVGGAMGTVFLGAGIIAGGLRNALGARAAANINLNTPEGAKVFTQRVAAYAARNPEFSKKMKDFAQVLIDRRGMQGQVPGGTAAGLTPRPSTGNLTQNELAEFLKIFSPKDLRGLRSPAEFRWALAQKIAPPLVQIGTVYTGTKGVQRLTGASPEEAEDAAIKNVLLDIAMAVGSRGVGKVGAKLKDAYEGLKGKWFRVDANGKPVDVVIDPDGNVHKASTPVDTRVLEAEFRKPSDPKGLLGPAPGEAPRPPAGEGTPPPPPTRPEPPAPAPKPALTGGPEPGTTVTRTFIEMEGKGKARKPNAVNREGEVFRDTDGSLKVRYEGPEGTKIEPLGPRNFSPETFNPEANKTGRWFPNEGQPPATPFTEAPPPSEAPMPPAGETPALPAEAPPAAPVPEGMQPQAPKRTRGTKTAERPTGEILPQEPPAGPLAPTGAKGKQAPPPKPKKGKPPTEEPPTQGPNDPPPLGTPKGSRVTKRVAYGGKARQIQGTYEVDDDGTPYIQRFDDKKNQFVREKPTRAWRVETVTAEAPPTPKGAEGGRKGPKGPVVAPPTGGKPPGGKKGAMPPEEGPAEPQKPAPKKPTAKKPAAPAEPLPPVETPAPTKPAKAAKKAEPTAKPAEAPKEEKPAEKKEAVTKPAPKTPVAQFPAKPDGKNPANGIDPKKFALPAPKTFPEKVRDDASAIIAAVKEGVREYNDIIRSYNEALKNNDAERIKTLTEDASDQLDGIVNRMRMLRALQEGKKFKPAKKEGEEAPIQRTTVKPEGKKKAEEEELEKPEGEAPTKRIDLVPQKGKKAKAGDTVYKPFPYAPEGFFEGKVVPSRDGEGLDVVFVNPRTGRKTRLPLTEGWSTAKPLPAGEAAPVKKKETAAEKKKAEAQKKKDEIAEKKKAEAEKPAEEEVAPAKEKEAPAEKKKEEKAVPTEEEAPRSDKEQEALADTDPDSIDWDVVVAGMPPHVKAEIRTRLDAVENGGKGESVLEVSLKMGLPRELVAAVPLKGPLGPFGQASYMLREAMKQPFTNILEDLVKALDKRIDVTDREKAANAVMDAMAERVGKQRSSLLNKDDFDKLNEFLIPRVSKETALTVLEAMEWQSKYSQAVRELQTHPFWKSRIDMIRNNLFTNWEDIPEAVRQDLIMIARAIGEKYGPRVTKARKLDNLFTDDAIQRAFEETLQRRGRPLFDETAPGGNIPGPIASLSKVNKNGEVVVKNDGSEPFYRTPEGRVVNPRAPEVVILAMDKKSISNLVEARLRLGTMDSQVATLIRERESYAYFNAQLELDSLGKRNRWRDEMEKADWVVFDDGVIVFNTHGQALINQLLHGTTDIAGSLNPNWAGQWFRYHGSMRSTELQLQQKLATAKGAQKTKIQTQLNTLNRLKRDVVDARNASVYGDFINIWNPPGAPYTAAMTLQEELSHRADFRSRHAATQLANLGYDSLASVKLPADKFKTLDAWKPAITRLKDFGYPVKNTEWVTFELVAKSFRSDYEEQLGVTDAQRWDIIETYATVLAEAGVTPETVTANFRDIGPYNQQFIDAYEKHYERANPGVYERRREGGLNVTPRRSSELRQERAKAYEKYLGNPTQYRPEYSIRKTGKGDEELVITTPQLKDRKVEYVSRADGDYLRSPNHPEVKLTPQEVNAIALTDTVARPALEDAIYVGYLQSMPAQVKINGKNRTLYPPTIASRSLQFVRRVEQGTKELGAALQALEPTSGPYGVTWAAIKYAGIGAYRVWRTKRSVRSSLDLSGLKQGAKLIFGHIPFRRVFNEQGRRANEINENILAEQLKIWKEIELIDAALADPVAMRKKGYKHTDETLNQWRLKALQEIDVLNQGRVVITKKMTEIKFTFLLANWVEATLGSLMRKGMAEQDLPDNPVSRRLLRRYGGQIPGEKFFHDAMQADPNYDTFEEAGVEYSTAQKLRDGMEVTDGWNTGQVFTDIRTVMVNKPEKLADGTITMVPRPEEIKTLMVRTKRGKEVPLTEEWTPTGFDTRTYHDMHGYSFLTKKPVFESKFGKRTLKEALDSNDPENIAGYFIGKSRQTVAKPFVMTQAAYDTGLAYVRHRAMQDLYAEGLAYHALKGKPFNKELVLKKLAERINRLSGTFSGDPETAKGALLNLLLPVLNIVMFSSRWQSSNFAFFAPKQYGVFGSPRELEWVHKVNRRQTAMLAITTLVFLAALDQIFNLLINFDEPTDIGYLRIPLGDRSIDIGAGLFKVMILLARNGEVVYKWMADIWERQPYPLPPKPPKAPGRFALNSTVNYFAKTLSPEAQDLYVALNNETVLGEPMSFWDHFLKTWGPITAQNAIEDYIEHGQSELPFNGLEFFGVQHNRLDGPDRLYKKMEKSIKEFEGGPLARKRHIDQWIERLRMSMREHKRREKVRQRRANQYPFQTLYETWTEGNPNWIQDDDFPVAGQEAKPGPPPKE